MAAGRRVAAGCGHHAQTGVQPVDGKDWRSVLSDWGAYGRFTQPHSCAAVVVARAAATSLKGDPVLNALNAYERRVCVRGNVWAVQVGMSNTDVATVAGAPIPWLSGPHCWSYHAGKQGTSIDGLTFCFDRTGRVADIKTAFHL